MNYSMRIEVPYQYYITLKNVSNCSLMTIEVCNGPTSIGKVHTTSTQVLNR